MNLNKPDNYLVERKAFAYRNNVLEASNASSGGAFRRIADLYSDENPSEIFIYGAAWSNDFKVKHKRIAGIDGVRNLQGSKYSKSDLRGVFQEVKQDLENGAKVLFSGTPCQVSSLNKYLQIKNVADDNLLTVDLICHGAPNPKFLTDYINWLEKKYRSSVTNIKFRDKSIGWKRYPTTIEFKNGKTAKFNYDTQLYIRLFMSAYILDKGCGSCPYSNTNRVSDITIGDFWGIEEVVPEFPTSNGVSLILLNTKKGLDLFEKMKIKKLPDEFIVDCTDQDYIKYQHNLKKPTDLPKDIDEFRKLYKEKGFSSVIKSYGMYTKLGGAKYKVKEILYTLFGVDLR